MARKKAVELNWIVYRCLLWRARWSVLWRQYENGARWASGAALWAMHNVTGEFRSAGLERLVSGLGPRLPIPQETEKRTDVLHVMTSASEVGGHTRWIVRWIKLDHSRRHSVIVTEQAVVPPSLASAVVTSGGDAVGIDPTMRIFERARAVRKAAAGADLVVLAQDPHDIVPALALDYERPPAIAICNHGDHVPLVGVNLANVIVEQREHGAQLSRDRRAALPERQVMMPLPLPEQALDRGSARSELGYGDEDIVVLTMGTAYKYLSDRSYLTDVFEAFLAHLPSGRVIAVGPGMTDPWAPLGQSGQAQIFGPTPNVERFQAAADIYVDSYPIGSDTALLESAARGTACLALQPPHDVKALMTDAPGLTGLPRLRTTAELAGMLMEWANDPVRRHRAGTQLQKEVLTKHADSAVREAIERVHQVASERRPAAGPAAPREATDTDRRLQEVWRHAEQLVDVRQVVAYSFGSRRLIAQASAVDLALRLFERSMD